MNKKKKKKNNLINMNKNINNKNKINQDSLFKIEGIINTFLQKSRVIYLHDYPNHFTQ